MLLIICSIIEGKVPKGGPWVPLSPCLLQTALLTPKMGKPQTEYQSNWTECIHPYFIFLPYR